MRYQAVTDIFFDLDHTLWDFDRNSYLAFERVFKKHEIPLSVTEFIGCYEPINLAYWKRYREEQINKDELRRGRLIDAFKDFGITFPIQKIDVLAHAYIEELPVDNHLFDGTVALLEYLNKKYGLHIITNGFHEVQFLKLNKSGIGKYFRTVTTSEEVGLKKPNPLIFKSALNKAEANPDNSLMIGDSFEADILGAEAVGMQTLFFNYRGESIPEHYLAVRQLSDVMSHL